MARQQNRWAAERRNEGTAERLVGRMVGTGGHVDSHGESGERERERGEKYVFGYVGMRLSGEERKPRSTQPRFYPLLSAFTPCPVHQHSGARSSDNL